jgi:hypothetical protein
MKLFCDSGYTAFRLGRVGLALAVTEATEIHNLSADVIRRSLEQARGVGGQSHGCTLSITESVIRELRWLADFWRGFGGSAWGDLGRSAPALPAWTS